MRNECLYVIVLEDTRPGMEEDVICLATTMQRKAAQEFAILMEYCEQMKENIEEVFRYSLYRATVGRQGASQELLARVSNRD